MRNCELLLDRLSRREPIGGRRRIARCPEASTGRFASCRHACSRRCSPSTALLVPAAAPAAPDGPPVPATITLPSKIVQGQSTIATVCLDRVPDSSDRGCALHRQRLRRNGHAGDRRDRAARSVRDLHRPVEHDRLHGRVQPDRQRVRERHHRGEVLPIVPFAGYDLVEITRAEVNRSFTKLTVTATSDEPGAVLTAFVAGVPLGELEPKGDRYVGRFDLDGTPVNNVEVQSSLGGCASAPCRSATTPCTAEDSWGGARTRCAPRAGTGILTACRRCSGCAERLTHARRASPDPVGAGRARRRGACGRRRRRRGAARHAYDSAGVRAWLQSRALPLRAIRAVCPGVPVSLTTSAAVEPDPGRRRELVAGWTGCPSS